MKYLHCRMENICLLRDEILRIYAKYIVDSAKQAVSISRKRCRAVPEYRSKVKSGIQGLQLFSGQFLYILNYAVSVCLNDAEEKIRVVG